MVMQSVESVPVALRKSTVSRLAHDDSRIAVRSVDQADALSDSFFSLGFSIFDDSNLSLYTVSKSEAAPNNSAEPAVQRIAVLPSRSLAYFDASHPLLQANKETLTSLLEFAEGAGCSTVHACVPKDAANLKSIVSSYGAVGFSPVPPKNGGSGAYLMLGFEM